MLAKEREIVNASFVADPMTYNQVRGGNPSNFGLPGLDPSGAGRKGAQASRERMSVILEADPEFHRRAALKGGKTLRQRYADGTLVATGDSFRGKRHSSDTKAKIGSRNAITHTGDGNNQFGKVWVHRDGEGSRSIRGEDLETYLSDGWARGRRCAWGVEARERYRDLRSKTPPNPPADAEPKPERTFNRGTLWIHRVGGGSRRVPAETLEVYLAEGWVRGRGPYDYRGLNVTVSPA